MGKAHCDTMYKLLDNIVTCLHSSIIIPLTLSTQTVSFKLNIDHINLHYATKYLPNSMFEAELFPALSINLWKPLHVNVFANGKVVILGKDALCKMYEIENWLLNKLK